MKNGIFEVMTGQTFGSDSRNSPKTAESEQRKERVFAAIRDFQQGRKQGHRSPHRGKRNRSSTLTYPLEF